MEIYTYGDGDFLSLILKATAAGFQGGGMMALLKMAAMFGMLFAIAQASISGQTGKTTSQLFTTMIIVMGLIAPVMTVRVVDTTQIELFNVNQEDHLIKGVPLGIGLPASLASTVGYFLAKSFEDKFTTIKAESGRFSYSQSGLMFAHAAIEANMKQKIRDPRTVRNMNHFWKNCVFYDIHFGMYTEVDLFKTTNVIEFLGKSTSAARSFTYITDGSKTPTIVGCKAGWPDLAKDIAAELDREDGRLGDFLVHKITGNRFNPKYNGDNITFAKTAQQSMAIMGLASAAEGEKTAQAMLYNSLKAGTRNLAGETDSGTLIQNIAISQGQREQRMSLTTAGMMARRYIPMLKNIADAVLFAVAPIVFVIAMFGNGFGVLSHYAKAMFAFSLWPVMFSVLNIIMIYKTKNALTAAGVATGDGLRFYAIALVPEVLQDQAALAGGLCLAIPTLSFAIVYGGGAALAGSLGASTGAGQASAANTANSMSKGDFSMANQSYGNITANQQKFSPSYEGGSSFVSAGNNLGIKDTTAGEMIDAGRSNLPISASSENSKSSKLSQQMGAAQRLEEQAQQSKASKIGQAYSAVSRQSESFMTDDRFSKEDRQALANAVEFASGHSQGTKKTADQKAVLSAGSSIGVNIGLGEGGRGVSRDPSGAHSGMPAGAGGGASGFNDQQFGEDGSVPRLNGGQLSTTSGSGSGTALDLPGAKTLPGGGAGGSGKGGGGSKLGAKAGAGVGVEGREMDITTAGMGIEDSQSNGTKLLDTAQRIDSVNRAFAAAHGVQMGNESAVALSEAKEATVAHSRAQAKVQSLSQEMGRSESNTFSVSSNESGAVLGAMVRSGATYGDISAATGNGREGAEKRAEISNAVQNSSGSSPSDVAEGGFASGPMELGGMTSGQVEEQVEAGLASSQAKVGAPLNTGNHNQLVENTGDAVATGFAEGGKEKEDRSASQSEITQDLRKKDHKPTNFSADTATNLSSLKNAPTTIDLGLAKLENSVKEGTEMSDKAFDTLGFNPYNIFKDDKPK